MSEWVRVTRQRPCPACGGRKWCSVSADGNVCICMRVDAGAKKQTKNGGWLHILHEDSSWLPRRGRVIRLNAPRQSRPDIVELAVQYQLVVNEDALDVLANDLGLSVESLRRLEVGWNGWAWSFPMKDSIGRVRGIRLRRPDGRKLAVSGSREALFIPRGVRESTDQGLLAVAEGPTDCAALLDLGFAAVGRPSCRGGVQQILDLTRGWSVRQAVIVADMDEHGRGQRGAEDLAKVLTRYVVDVRIVHPPTGVKDARQWKRLGATHDDVKDAIQMAQARSLTVTISEVERHGC